MTDPFFSSRFAQSDAMFRIPPSCRQRYRNVFSYRIRDVYMYGSRFVAVVLNTGIPGFEGADGRFRVAAGALPVNRI